MNLVITKKPDKLHMVVVEEAAVDVEVAVEALEVAVALASNVEKRVTFQETALPSNLLDTAEEDVVAVVAVAKDPVLVTSADRRDITPVIALQSPLVGTEVDVHSVDRDLELATSVEKRDISSETAPRRRDPVVQDRSNATPATRWDICLVTALRDASPDKEVATALTANSPDIWLETALKVTLVAVEVVSVVVTDPPVPVTDADKKVTLSLTALSPIPEARRRTKRSDTSESP